jgi:hypothetical protein
MKYGQKRHLNGNFGTASFLLAVPSEILANACMSRVSKNENETILLCEANNSNRLWLLSPVEEFQNPKKERKV